MQISRVGMTRKVLKSDIYWFNVIHVIVFIVICFCFYSFFNIYSAALWVIVKGLYQ